MAKKPRVTRKKKESRTLTAEDHDFIRQILAGPDEDGPRLAYADWLQRQGDGERAEFIRCQVEAARLRPADPRRQPLDARAAVLLEAHQEEWLALPPELAHVGRVCCFERGFPVWARCCITLFAEDGAPHLPHFWRFAPITQLEFYELNAGACWEGDLDFDESWISVTAYEALAKMPQLVHVRTLSLGECAIRAQHLEAILASPHLTNLRELLLTSNRLGDAGAGVVAESARGASLTYLDLNTNEVGGRGAEALAQSPRLANLKRLDLRWNKIGAEGGRAIASSPSLANLEKLELGGNELGAAEEELRRRFGDRLTL